MALTNSPYVKLQFFDANGDPAADYQLFTYDSGTATKRDTFTEADGSALNTNPIILDAAGRCVIYLSPVNYKYVLALPTDSDPPLSPIWTIDPVVPSSSTSSGTDVAVTAGEVIAAGAVIYLSDGSGGATVGSWYNADADQTYSSSAASIVGFATAAIASGSTGTATVSGRVTGLSGLTAGTDYYVSATAGALTSTAPTNGRWVGRADTTTSLVMGPNQPDASVTRPGVVNIGAQTFKGVKSVLIGAATTLPGVIGGTYFTDVVEHSVTAGSTDTVLSTTTIPANMLNANGKGLRLLLGSTTACTGANAHTIELDVGGTQIQLYTSTLTFRWHAHVDIVRIDADSVDVFAYAFIAGTGTDDSTTTRINGLDFTAAITLQSLGTTGAVSTLAQTYFRVEAVG